jgi:DNA polymerase III subunit delta'
MLIGHAKTITDLKDLTKRGALAHGYIFHGPSMTGKRTVAMAFARFLETGKFEAMNDHSVLQDAKLIDLDFMKTLDKDTKDSIGIDAVREIRNFLWQKPNVSAHRTLIIDEAEFLTNEAQNALLKITEEPPASALLILITSDIEAILPTIASRLPKVYFGTVAPAEIKKWILDSSAAAKALGKPGLAWRLKNDKEFVAHLALAEKFLKAPAAGRKDLIKKIIDPDDFSLRNFLEAVIITLAWEKPSKAKAALWHKALALEENATNFGLNPRLQLETLMRI